MNRHILLFFFAVLFSAMAHAQIITTIAGTDTAGYNGDNIAATAAKLHYPKSVAVDSKGNVYIGDIGNYRIRKIDVNGIITNYGGNGTPGYSGDGGPATAAQLNASYMVMDNLNNLYFTDPVYNRVRMISPNGTIRCVAGTGSRGYGGDGGPATAAIFDAPSGLATDDTGNVYVADHNNNRIRKITYRGVVSTIAGGGNSILNTGGVATDAAIYLPEYITTDRANNIYVLTNSTVRKITTDGRISDSTYLVLPATVTPLFYPGPIAVDNDISLYVSNTVTSSLGRNNFYKIRANGMLTQLIALSKGNSGDGGPASLARLLDPAGIATDRAGNMYIADYGNHNVRRITNPYAAVKLHAANQGSINIFPNPSNGTFTVCITTPVTENAMMRITDMTCREVKTCCISTNNNENINCGLSPGIYFLHAETADGVYNNQMIIK